MRTERRGSWRAKGRLSMADIIIMLERVIDRFGEYGGYDPSAQYARPTFYAHITQEAGGDMPTELEVRLSLSSGETMMTITPHQLNENGDLYFPLTALESAIEAIQNKKETNARARSEQVGVVLEGAEGSGEEAES